jgi:hypothetical protein
MGSYSLTMADARLPVPVMKGVSSGLVTSGLLNVMQEKRGCLLQGLVDLGVDGQDIGQDREDLLVRFDGQEPRKDSG